jgi:hypothetical protein
VKDVDLLLAAAIASVRMTRQTSVFEPPASLAACARCQEAHAEARKVIEDAGRDREVDGVGGEAVKDETVLIFSIAGSVPDVPGRLRGRALPGPTAAHAGSPPR